MYNRRHSDPARLTIAQHAVYAARNRYAWGRNAAHLYCEHRQVPAGLYRLACQLQAVQALSDYQTIDTGGNVSC